MDAGVVLSRECSGCLLSQIWLQGLDSSLFLNVYSLHFLLPLLAASSWPWLACMQALFLLTSWGAGVSLSSLFLPLSSPLTLTHTAWPPSDRQPAISLLASMLTTQLFEDLGLALQQVLSIQSAQGSETSDPLVHREAVFVIMWPDECSACSVSPGNFSY